MCSSHRGRSCRVVTLGWCDSPRETIRWITDAFSVHRRVRTFPSRNPASRRYRRCRLAIVDGKWDVMDRSVHASCGSGKPPRIHCIAVHGPRRLQRRSPPAAHVANIARAIPLRAGHGPAPCGAIAPGGPIVPGNLPGIRNVERFAAGYLTSPVYRCLHSEYTPVTKPVYGAVPVHSVRIPAGGHVT